MQQKKKVYKEKLKQNDKITDSLYKEKQRK